MMNNPSAELKEIKKMSEGTLITTLGIEFTRVKPGYVEATMPIDERTKQPYGLLHGGASAALAETLGSVGSHLLVHKEGKAAVGIEINTNHIASKRSGIVTGKAKIIHQGNKLHVWQIDIYDEADKLIATSRLTVMIIISSKS